MKALSTEQWNQVNGGLTIDVPQNGISPENFAIIEAGVQKVMSGEFSDQQFESYIIKHGCLGDAYVYMNSFEKTFAHFM